MAAYKIINMGNDFENIKASIKKLIKEEVEWQPATSRTPGAVWFDISKVLPDFVKEKLSKYCGRPLHDIFWMTDYLDCKSLEIHQDNPGNEYPVTTRFTLILMLEGVFRLSIWNDEGTEVLDTVVVSSGEFVVLNNSQYYHSGEVISGQKLSLHAYPRVEEIDDLEVVKSKFQVDDYI